LKLSPSRFINDLSKTDKHQNLVGMFAELDLTKTRFQSRVIHVEDFPATYEYLPIGEPCSVATPRGS
jgi:hypothetical protein